MASAEGAARTPAHRGFSYVVFEDLQLADYGNRIPSLTFEVFADEGEVGIAAIADALSGGKLTGTGTQSVMGFVASGQSVADAVEPLVSRSEEHTSELQSLMRISYAVFCLKKNK